MEFPGLPVGDLDDAHTQLRERLEREGLEPGLDRRLRARLRGEMIFSRNGVMHAIQPADKCVTTSS